MQIDSFLAGFFSALALHAAVNGEWFFLGVDLALFAGCAWVAWHERRRNAR